ncbi:MAG: GDP-mannose 4,6-dehydratase [Candidatus Marinimicrobia bacterium]|nr:GDP-mannose 4,6-dehydratase [Candidatus Neomarinimicrobiota bacterium]
MRVWVTGAAGFVGRHVLADLARAGHEVYGFDVAPAPAGAPVAGWTVGDLTEAEAVAAGVGQARPAGCIHLGGIAFVPAGWETPRRVFDINAGGTIQVLEAVRRAAPGARLLMVSSAEIYGRVDRPAPLDEETAPAPENPYAISKLAAELTTLVYARRYDQPFLTVRPDNHFGPGQAPAFVAPAFARQLAAIAAGHQAPILRVGNLDDERDFLDVRDVARAYRLLLEQAPPGQPYNLSSGRRIAIRTLLDQFCRLAGVTPRIEVDPDRWRSRTRSPAISAERARRATGWAPEIPLETTLAEVYAEAVAAVSSGV